MVIRPEQVEALRAARISPYLDRIVKILRARIPESAYISDADLRSFCRVGASKCRSYGMMTERNVYCFITAHLILGWSFEEPLKSLKLGEALLDPTIDEDHKAQLIELELAATCGRGI